MGRTGKGKEKIIFHLVKPGSPANRWLATQKERSLFDFLEDQRSNDYALEPFVSTGHANGVITINILEAEPVARAAEQMVRRNIEAY